ncbi:radical SAM protein [Chitiniphilus purpureus]|uniref:Radical SAM protein n=1 Tax=Chitiniphilus purpureus TaxID=2981137 RepID=A0ABY6DI75_9NEIS|nr:radical SAM protein [Chitiniphilus sp. CD1]UXY14026.1 radical SAM protein [Chitiniphilus sp. CD1]
MPNRTLLRVDDHARDVAGYTYVYPVVSRRAGGVSVGINLNPNNACNWRCVYCQVPDLTRGGPPSIDLAQLEHELDAMLHALVHGDFMQTRVPEGARRLNDIAFSGNGEPTMSPDFPDALATVEAVLRQHALLGRIKVVLITNGSQLYRERVQAALPAMRAMNGEVWFKLDRAPADGFSVVNQVQLNREAVARHLALCAARCPTWLQTCMFMQDGQLPDEATLQAYLDFIGEQRARGVTLQGVLLYGLARPSMQPEAPQLASAPSEWMQALAERITALGLPVRLSA